GQPFGPGARHVFLHVQGEDAGAFGRQLVDAGAAHAVGPAGDDHHLAVEPCLCRHRPSPHSFRECRQTLESLRSGSRKGIGTTSPATRSSPDRTSIFCPTVAAGVASMAMAIEAFSVGETM